MRTATITIKPDAITHNLAQVKKRAPNSRVLAMVKANAYGHGIDAVLPALEEADAIGVATFAEASEARQLGWTKGLGLIEGVFSADEWQRAIDFDCSCVIHHEPQLAWALANTPKADSSARTVWLKFNSGMNRLGFDETGVIDAAQKLNEAGYEIILTSHFANADHRHHPLNAIQIKRFTKVLHKLRHKVSADVKASLCNSAGIINFADSHYDWVRPGIMLYGSAPVNDHSAEDLELLPTMIFTSQIMALQTVTAGDAIGYGSRWVAPDDTRVALISVGYGDGYPRVIEDGAYVRVVTSANDSDYNSHQCPIIGRVAMDMLVIDISATPADLALNSKVILWGDSPSIDEIARWAGTISYELFCRLSPRPTRTIA